MITCCSDQDPTINHSYMHLIRQYTLHRIRDDADYDRAAEMLYALSAKAERGESLDDGEAEYMAALEDLIEQYDERHYLIPQDDRTPIQRLKYLMKHAQLQQKDLADIMGVSKSAISMILAGDRQLTLDQLKRLAAHFRLSVDYFI